MRKLAGITFLFMTVLFSSCTKEELGNTMSQQTGKLVLNDLEVSASVSDQLSRATLDTNLPSGNEFVITVKSKASSFEQTLEEGVFECILPVGTYTVEAVYGEDVVSLDTPYFYGETSVEITEGATAPVSITATLQSAIIRPVMDEALLAQYKDYSLSVSDANNTMTTIANNTDLFVPAGKDYTLWLMGENQLGNQANTSWNLNQLSAKTRYIVSCNADLPSFTFPQQAETNAWSKFMYITPMTTEIMSSHSEMAEQVIANIVYEASADGSTWLPATYDAAKEKWVIKDLQPETQYTVRSRFGGVISTNTQTLTTENAQELVNGEMDNWNTPDEYSNYANGKVYFYSINNWGTRNTLTMDGVQNGSSSWTDNERTAYRWNSCTIPTSGETSEQAAEIRTMGLANFEINSGTFGSWLAALKGNRSKMVENVLANANIFVGYLYTGTEDVTTQAEPDPNSYKIEHTARPLSLSFDYQYAPYNNDNFVVSAYLFDEAGNQIAHTNEYKNGSTQNSYTAETLDFIYDNASTKAGYIYIIFKSGEKNTVNDVKHIEGSYGANPWSLDTFIGSVLKIDNIKLNYDYE